VVLAVATRLTPVSEPLAGAGRPPVGYAGARFVRTGERVGRVVGGRASRLTRGGGTARESLFGTGNRRTIGSI